MEINCKMMMMIVKKKNICDRENNALILTQDCHCAVKCTGEITPHCDSKSSVKNRTLRYICIYFFNFQKYYIGQYFLYFD